MQSINNSKVNLFHTLGTGPLGILCSYFSPRDLCHIRPVSKDFLALVIRILNTNPETRNGLNNRKWFEEHQGKISSRESHIDLNEEYRKSNQREHITDTLRDTFRENLILNPPRREFVYFEEPTDWASKKHFVVSTGGDLKLQSIEKTSFFNQALFYLGWHNWKLERSFKSIHDQRLKLATQLQKENAPKTLIEQEGILKRVNALTNEMQGIKLAVQVNEIILANRTEKLDFPERILCKISQSIFYPQSPLNYLPFMPGPISRYESMQRLATPLVVSNLEESNYLVYTIAQGKFSNSPNAGIGLKIGDTQLTPGAGVFNVGVYAQPLPHIISDFYMRPFKNQIQFSSYFAFNFSNAFDACGSLWIQRSQSQNLQIKLLVAGANNTHIMIKLIQLAVEIFVRDDAKSLSYTCFEAKELVKKQNLGFDVDYSSFAYIFTAAGFDSLHKAAFEEEIRKARLKGKLFPDANDVPENERARFSIELDLSSMSLQKEGKKSILETQVDFGNGVTTWGEIIKNSPILSGSGPVLPPNP